MSEQLFIINTNPSNNPTVLFSGYCDSHSITHSLTQWLGKVRTPRCKPATGPVEQKTNLLIGDDKKRPAALNLTPARTGTADSSSSDESLKPRTPRFAEATSVHSPVDSRGPFADPESSQVLQLQVGDVGFGYLKGGNRESSRVPMTPKTPLKSAMKVPGTPARQFNNPLSPMFREEDVLEKREGSTDKEQARDLV